MCGVCVEGEGENADPSLCIMVKVIFYTQELSL